MTMMFLKTMKSAALLAALFAAAGAVAAEPEFFPRKAAPGQSYPFSEAVRVGDMLYLSGDIGVGADGKLVGGGVKAEAKQVMDNIAANLARHGSSFDHVVQCTVALADIADWPAFNEVYKSFFTDHYPARSAFGVGGLALGARVEIECIAAVAK